MSASSDRWVQYRADVEARLDFVQIYSDIEGAKPSGNGWQLGLCPFHEDHDPSFGFEPKTGQWECFAGCGKGSVFDYLMRRSSRGYRQVLCELGERLGLPPPSGNGDGAREIVYPYRDEGGALLYEVRRGPGKKFWQRRPKGDGGWINDLKGVRRVLYRLPELLARPNETVFIVEGEKDVERLLSAGLLATTNSGGAGKWRREYSDALRGREVVILPDNDAPGRDHGQLVATSLQGVAANIKLLALPGLPEKGDVSDWLDAGHTAAELRVLAAATASWEANSGDLEGLPVIVVNDRQLRDVIADAWAALLPIAIDRRLFRHAGGLARVVESPGGPQVSLLDEASSFGLLVREADWVVQRGPRRSEAKPPRELARDLLSAPHPDLPAIEGVVATPVFTGGGRLVTTPGYDAESGLWYEPAPGFSLPEIPDCPTEDDVAAAVQLLAEELLVDFEFAAESDLAHAMAALILPFVRRLIDGPTPIHLLEAPTPGSGKSLLADLIAIVTLGRSCEATTVTRNEDESRKKLTAILARGHPVVVLDNIQGALESAQLSAAITAEVWSDRILGRSQMVELPNRALWIVTGNNPKLSMEIARRCVRVRIEPHVERPWERTQFKHNPIRSWAREHRAELVAAILVIVQRWLTTGRPRGTKTLGSFETWATTIGGILSHAGVRDFLEDTSEFYETADPEAGEWRAFVTAWDEQHHNSPVAPSVLLALAEAQNLVPFAYPGATEQARLAKFGKSLGALRGRRFGNLQVAVTENRKRCSKDYRLVPVAQDLFSGEGASE